MNLDDPLAKMRSSMSGHKRGRLKVFLGMAAGVGKTFAMLSEAHTLVERGEEVVVGYVEPHGRRETESLLDGLEAIPHKTVEHRGVTLRDFDLDEALRRKPRYLLVDELAHSNTEGFRHAKRWQDIEECLQAGINVFTTVNIQHIESLRDLVAQITHVQVAETVPDSFMESADEIELVDIPPEQLHQRLKDGKVYQPEKVDQALAGFFKRGNLLALRELSLRHTAQQVDRTILDERSRDPQSDTWQVSERILVCLAPNRMAPRVVRAAKRLAASLHAEMIVVTVNSPRQAKVDGKAREQLEYALSLADKLGARTVSLAHQDIAAELIRFARAEGATTIVMGKPVRPRWKEILFGSVVDATIRASGDIDVLVITGSEDAGTHLIRRPEASPIHWQGVVEAVLFPGLATLIGLAVYHPLQVTNIAMLYVVAAVMVSLRRGLKESILSSFVSVVCLNFFFVEPRFTFAVTDFRYAVTFVVMVSVSALLGGLTLRLKENSEVLAQRERRTSRLYEVTKRLSESRKQDEMAALVIKHLETELGCPVGVWLNKGDGLKLQTDASGQFEDSDSERAVAEWVFAHSKPAGAGTETLSGVKGFYLPLIGSECVLGVLGVLVSGAGISSIQLRYLEAVTSQLASAIDRTQFAKQAHERALKAESEEMRSNLLSAVSHDLRTPLASIEGSATALIERGQLVGTDRELAGNIAQESQRMTRLIRNLLDMTRVQGSIQLNLEWENLEDLVRNAVDRTEGLFTRSVAVKTPPEPLILKVDGVLIEQVLVNLLENSARYAGSDAEVLISFGQTSKRAWLIVKDDGPGIPPEMLKTVFESFQRSSCAGFGLGLAICKAAIEAHGGEIEAMPTRGGAEIRWEVPVEP